MKIAIRLLTTLAAALSILGAAHAASPPFYLHDGDRVVMYGDSITEMRLYTMYTEEFVTTRFPNLKIDWDNAGWSGDRVVGGYGGAADVRIQRDVSPYRPTVVTMMLGMNDGRFGPLNQETYDSYKTGYAHIVDTIKKGDPTARFTFIQPSPYDEITQPPMFPGGYNSVLLRFGSFVKDFGAQTGQTVTDFNAPVVTLLQKARALDPAIAPSIVRDHIHPSPGANLLMAEALLKSWNAPGSVSSIAIDASRKSVTYTDNTIAAKLLVTDIVTWDQTDGALPMPFDLSDPTTIFALSNSDFFGVMDRQVLQVNRLPAANYILKIDSKTVGTFTRDQLGHGVNLAALETPMLFQARQVAQLTEYHNNLQFQRWRSIQVPLATEPDPSVQAATKELIRTLNLREAAIVASMRVKAQPALHHFSLTPAS